MQRKQEQEGRLPAAVGECVDAKAKLPGIYTITKSGMACMHANSPYMHACITLQ
jgi:hypothetical protein